jgi:pimeloyl-ACP methyl ester carboxylesterase
MKRLGRWLLIVLGALLAVVFVGPFLVPVPPLEGTLPPEQLADPDSRFIEVDGIKVHYKRAGQGEPTLILLHGFAASEFSWREVISPLATMGTVIAYDRPAFGLTARPMPGEWTGRSPYSSDAQADMLAHLMDAWGIKQAILVGNSAGGTIATLAALRYPERVQALVLVDPAIYTNGGDSGLLRLALATPQARRLGPLFARQIQSWGMDFARSAWHDPSKITPDVWAGYLKPLQAENWDRALWELTLASQPLGLDKQLDRITMPTLVITGDDDRIVPTAQSVRLAGELPNAQLVVVPNCGHIPHEECPGEFMKAVIEFQQSLKNMSQ